MTTKTNWMPNVFLVWGFWFLGWISISNGTSPILMLPLAYIFHLLDSRRFR